MLPELRDIARFLAEHPPFKDLPMAALERLAEQIEVSYVKAGTHILEYGAPIADLYIVRSGSVELTRRSGELYNRIAEGGIFGQMGLMMNRRVRFPAIAIEDTLLYCIPVDYYQAYCDEYTAFSDYFEAEQEGVLRHAVNAQIEHSDLSTVKINTCLHRPPVLIDQHQNIQQAAQLMTNEQVSAMLVTQSAIEQTAVDFSEIIGIVTDSDFRARALAEGLPHTTPITHVMTPKPCELDADSYLFEALLAMLRDNVHHLPIVDHGKVCGVLSMSDLLQHQSHNSLLYVRQIFTASAIEQLEQHARLLPDVFQRLVNEDANSQMIGSAMSSIARSFCQQLIHLAETELGPPPVPYCFIVLGSVAREEQSLVSDQDNALVLDNAYNETKHGDYFKQLSERVCQNLARCGYPLCSGDIMAQNPRWRMKLDDWQTQFSDWLEKPEPEALLHSNIFFDLEAVAGELALATTLQTFIADKAPDYRRFLACMARNALNRTPPLGFFKDFVVEPDGEYRDTINLKRRGTAPLTDLIRVHALAVGSKARNSFERLQDIDAAGILPEGKVAELSDALEYLSIVRMRHQARAVANNRPPDSQLNPKHLSAFERRSLKAAFQVLDNAQKFIKFRYTAQQAIR
ncbi:MAG: DUF294 nucleotidyltransferase-like domain-containing protein [Oleiphilaceae bacterium]|nr:DUF294 nucleotidyltransferase-like domain-containing protein [Oleiphilaceae bacterium]